MKLYEPSERPCVELSHAQKRLLLLESFYPGSKAYNLAVAYRISGYLNTDILKKSIADVINQHDRLRSRFLISEDGDFTSVIDSLVEGFVDILDVRALPEEQVKSMIQSCADEAFEVFGGKLLRASIYVLSEADSILLLSFHHAVVDGVSLHIINRCLSHSYNERLCGRKPEWDYTEATYSDFIRYEKSLSYEDDLAYWKNLFRNAKYYLDIPTISVRPEVRRFNASKSSTKISAEESVCVWEAAHKMKVTRCAIIFSALSVTLSRLSKQDSFIIGMPVANRCSEAFDDVVGLFSNIIPLSIEVNEAIGLKGLVNSMMLQIVSSISKQHVPFDKIVQSVSPDRFDLFNPMMQVVFNYIYDAGEALKLCGTTTAEYPLEPIASKCDMAFTAIEKETGYTIEVVYDSLLFSKDLMSNILAGTVSELSMKPGSLVEALLNGTD